MRGYHPQMPPTCLQHRDIATSSRYVIRQASTTASRQFLSISSALPLSVIANPATMQRRAPPSATTTHHTTKSIGLRHKTSHDVVTPLSPSSPVGIFWHLETKCPFHCPPARASVDRSRFPRGRKDSPPRPPDLTDSPHRPPGKGQADNSPRWWPSVCLHRQK